MKITIKLFILITALNLAGCQITSKINLPDTTITESTNKQEEATSTSATNLVEPIAEFKQRITKKPFGIFITPKNSPVQPERFSGYHNAVDVEYEDVTTDVPVYAITDGTVLYSGTVNGYGGVLAINHTIDEKNYVAIYGHLDPKSLIKKNDGVTIGQQIAILGDGYTAETANERKHLHFSLRPGDNLNLAGYVQSRTELNQWIDPTTLIN